jgi:hypothetical protein
MKDTSPQPAIDELHGEQKQLAEVLLDGFGTWTETYEWVHGVMVYSGGRLDRNVVRSVAPGLSDGFLRESLKGDEPEHRHAREMLLAGGVMPAFRSGLKEIRWKATEYGENPPDPEWSEHIVLRPAYDSLASKQKEVMKRGLSGFEDREGLLEWVQDAQRASLGEVPGDMGTKLGFRDRMALESFVVSEWRRENPEAAALTRFMVVGGAFLPWFKDALLKQLRRASEQSVEVEEEPTTYELEEEFTNR